MPKPAKKRSKDDVKDAERDNTDDSYSDSTSDSGPDDRAPAKKPAPARKAATASGSTGAKKERVGADGVSRPKPKQQGNPAVEGQEPTWELGWNKKVKVRSWKGRTFIDIREWYVDKSTMDTKPGKKGISLTPEQYQVLKAAMPEIDEALH